MTASDLVAQAETRGLELGVTAAGGLTMTGPASARAELRQALVWAKAELVIILRSRRLPASSAAREDTGHRYDTVAACLRIAERIPPLHVGEVWRDVPCKGATIEVKHLVPQEDIPWPMVHYERMDAGQDSDPRAGAPAFIYGTRVVP
jgi:hypothetical protein